MSTSLARVPLSAPVQERQPAHVSIDLKLLAAHGLDRGTLDFRPAQEDPLFFWKRCPVVNCGVDTAGGRFCKHCSTRWRRTSDYEAFIATPRPYEVEGPGPDLCLVCRTPGHERAAADCGLCGGCTQRRRKRGQSVQEYLEGGEYGPPQPFPSLGRCIRRGCARWVSRRNLCARCAAQLGKSNLSREAFVRTPLRKPPSPSSAGKTIRLAALPEQVRDEMLLVLSISAREGRRSYMHEVRWVVNELVRQEVSSLADLDVDGRAFTNSHFLGWAQRQLLFLAQDPESEALKDVWDMRVFRNRDSVRGRYLRFDGISQPWLRETSKEWAHDRIATVGLSRLITSVRATTELSVSLRRRADRGLDPSALGREDIATFLNRLARSAQVTSKQRVLLVRDTRRFLQEMRELGLTRPGRHAAGLSEDFLVREDDVPRTEQPEEATDRALPQVVMDTLLSDESLRLLEELRGEDERNAIEVSAWTGRRPLEIVRLPVDCVELDEAAGWLLVYDAAKRGGKARRLPIHEQAAALIHRQQERIRARFAEPTYLYPAQNQNPDGNRHLPVSSLDAAFRDWMEALPSLLGPDGNEYPRERVFPYAFRHSYAQRHADSGTPVDVLKELMNHRMLTSTQRYYTVPEKRKRMAAAAIAPLTLNHAGQLVNRHPDLDAMLIRQESGQVPVGLGWCTEPANVKAHGQSCPYRIRCLGCTHFRTDASFLPELQDHLKRLLVERERLAAAIPQVAEWARQDALPSDAEIDVVRSLIRSNDRVVKKLDAAERAAVTEAVALARRSRSNIETACRALACRRHPDRSDPEPRRGGAQLMADSRTAETARRRRLDSERKRQLLLGAVDSLLENGSDTSVLARRAAGVSKSFFYENPDLRAEVERRIAAGSELHSAAIAASGRVTAASYRAEAENWKAIAQRRAREIEALKRRLSGVVGRELIDELAENESLADDELLARNDELERLMFERDERIAELTEELEAVREINRELLARTNQTVARS